MRFATLADIHGNVWALDAVLRDLDRRGVDAAPYDRERAARAAEQSGRPDWAAWLRRGVG